MGGSMGDVMGPLQMAAGAGATAMGMPQVGLPLMASGLNQTAQPGGATGQALGNNQLMGTLGAMGGKMMQPQQPPQMMQPRMPAPASPLPAPPQASSAMAPPLQVPSQMGGMGGGQPQLTPQMLAMLRQRMGMG